MDSDLMEPATSFASTKDHDPYAFYGELHGRGDVVWDQTLGSWLVTSFSLCREIMLADDKQVMMPERIHNFDDLAAALGGERALNIMGGEEHFRLHNWWIRAMSPRRLLEWRQTTIRPLVNRMIDRFIGRGQAELAHELGDQIAIRVIAAIMGLPWTDDAWISHCKALNDEAQSFFERRLGLSAAADPAELERISADAAAASERLKDILLPYVRERSRGAGDDMVSAMWRDGPGLVPGWGEADIVANIRLMFQAGSDTTTYAVINGLYLLLTRPGLIGRLRDGGETAMDAFVEELLRLHGPVHFRSREALEDFEVGGVKLKKGDRILLVVGAANRDADRFPEPSEINLARSGGREHLAFHWGPRTCAGANLARAELRELVAAVIERLPDMRLDPGQPPPRMSGWLLRAYRPLHVTFSPGEARADLSSLNLV